MGSFSNYNAGHRGVDAHSATLTNTVLEVHVADFDIFNLPENVKAIPLSQGRHTIVDADWYEMLSKAKWFAHFVYGTQRFYASTSSHGKAEFMHRIILDAPKGVSVDHVNGLEWDNRRVNLRVCTHLQNMRNRKPESNSLSRYKGVSKHRHKWRATIAINRKSIFLGSYDTEEIAAMAYNEAAIKYFGEFAWLNAV